MNKRMILLCLIPGLLHCGPKRDTVERYVEDGVEVIVNHLEPYDIGGPSRLSLQELFTIDTEDEEIINLGIPDIFGFAVNSLGEIYILRNIQGEGDFVYMFDGSGKFIKSFGPQGQGPGEFQNPHHIAIDHGDNILIYDMGPQILHKYDRDGILIDDYRISGDEVRISAGPDGNLLAAAHSQVQDKGRMSNTRTLKLMNPDLEALRVIDEFSFEWRPERARIIEPLLCWSGSREHIFVANEDRGYEIWVCDSQGRLGRKIRKEHKRIPVSKEYQEKILKQFPEGMREQVRKMGEFPDYLPPIQNLVAADGGTLFVATFELGENPGEFLYDIFNPDGVFIGRTSLDVWIWEVHMWAEIKGCRLYCLQAKDSGFRQVVVYDMGWE